MAYKTISLTLGAIISTLGVIISCIGANYMLSTFYNSYCTYWTSFGSPVCSSVLALMVGGAGIYTYLFYLIVATVGLIVVNLLKSLLTSNSTDSLSAYQMMNPTQKILHLDKICSSWGLLGGRN